MDIVFDLIKKYGTNNAFTLSERAGIDVCIEDLGKNVWGYYARFNRVPQIHINIRLDDNQKLFAAGHELGHKFLHPSLNTPFLRKNTLFCVDKLEREANQFSIQLLIGHSSPFEGETTYEFLLRCGLPYELHSLYKPSHERSSRYGLYSKKG